MKKLLILVCSALVCLSSPVFAKSLKIGMVIDDLRLERWQKDRDIFVDKAEELGAKVYVQSANGNEQTQISQVENMISRGVDVLVIIPTNGGVLSNVISDAKRDGIKVLAYDRLISDADIDFYLSFDNERVGEMQAQAMLDAKPKGNYFLMGGAPTDNNAKLFRKGQMNILQPKIDSGDIKVVGDQWVNYWLAENALKIMENALTANNNKIDVVVASNDATAGGAIQALEAQGLAGKVSISGQDADLAALRRIVDGTQTMTIYKPINTLASRAAEIAVELADGKTPAQNSSLNNGMKDVPAWLLDPVAVTSKNIKTTVVRDGFHAESEIYQ
ncbi:MULTISPECIES: D-xylose ABC transporter substrate-binding protein [Vibrio]|jgi:D-xylose transport system substrate-binding protein|uniref:Autoinducer 2-binding periplasmic protein LuxP n=1 Tax=Vibrio diazotrophicus TaxID=685 RepID=A0A2J8HCM4_VIBDI|nr:MULTISPECIES: D-xylose ABC transporter substrate-binding protein [Vibrio]MCF7363678.1 D-xylose ABC transporter substrate-binding protein [Vibrio sp. A1-b2]MCZ4372420.1 D-xylose ABC transporter substrate-binding protein [Vibrio diazotrophicus]PNH96026.1 D-xylose ABC transporter substrate-binding protein [Vibrio diazotrophicus]PNI03377.1 D-xylose ABC transporter substrate-binding protein [Vibrio diazotrophicus]RAS61052.1 xylose-binding protein [Vibrio diazotrophicus]